MFTGSMVALVTPFKNGKVDEGALRKLVDRQIEAGTDVLVPCGTTGESATLTHEEHDQVVGITIDQAAKRVKVLAGAGSNATHEAIRLTQSAAKLGADGTLQISPYYNKPTPEGVYQHYKAIAEATPLPMLVYNVPSRTALNMQPDLVARLAEVDNIVGVKEAAGSLEQVEALVAQTPDDFVVISGEDGQTLEMYQRGAKGAISVTANVLPEQNAQLWQTYSSGNIDEATQIQNKMMPIHNAMFIETNPIPVKTALALMGLIAEEFRLPLVPIAESNKQKLKEILQKEGVL